MADKARRTELIKWAVMAAGLVMVGLIPCGGVFTMQMKMFLMVVAFAILACGMAAMDNMMIGILIPLGFKLFQVAPADVIYGGWSGTTPMVTFGSLLLAVVLEETGLLKRISLFCITKSGGTYKGACYGVLLAGFACSLLTSCNVMFVFAALAYGVCRTLDMKPSMASAGIMTAAMLGSITSYSAIYYPAAMGILLEAGGVQVSWLQSMTYTLPGLLFIIFFMWFLLKFVIPAPEINAKEELERQYKELGSMTTAEKKAVAVILGIMGSLVLSQWTGMDTAWPFLIAPWLFFVPGMWVGNGATLKKVNVGMVFLVAGFLSIGNVANYLGIGQTLGNYIMPLFEGKSLIMVVVLTFLLGAVANLALTPFAMYTAFGGMLTSIYGSLGLGSLAALYILQYTGDVLVFPYESLVYLVYMSFGMISMKHFIKIYALKSVFTLVWILVFMIPWWRMMGIL